MLAFPALILFQFGLIDGIKVTGSITVTLAVFSGRPDPTWTLDPKDSTYGPIKRSLGELKPKNTHGAKQMPPRLGYKGFLIRSMTDEVLIVGSETKKLQVLLLESIPQGTLLNGTIEDVKEEIESDKATASTTPPVSPAQGPKRVKRFEPRIGMWSPSFRTIKCNNCYNYANTLITDNFAQPGFSIGHVFGQMDGASVQQAAESDGLIPLNPQPGAAAPVPPAPAGFAHLVALVVDPGTSLRQGDFHWYRLDQYGVWSHKPGSTFVTALDNAGALISDPRVADMGHYRFVSFMYSDITTVNIAGNLICPY
ncbi:uncharacterized protein [Montipora capricornis]|uniref:uncharacterized protein n=1 Tax=Montipora capricornis TaxID=246305 RepID=UPI0035F10A47